MALFDFDDLFGAFEGGTKKEEEKKEKAEVKEEIKTEPAAEEAGKEDVEEEEIVETVDTENTSVEDVEEEKPKASNTKSTKKASSSKKVEKCNAPIKVCMPYTTIILDAVNGKFTDVTAEDIAKELKSRNYYDAEILTAVFDAGKQTCFFCFPEEKAAENDHMFSFDNGPVKFSYGERQVEFTAKNFDGKTEVEITEVVAAANFEMEDCSFFVGENHIIPLLQKTNKSFRKYSCYGEYVSETEKVLKAADVKVVKPEGASMFVRTDGADGYICFIKKDPSRKKDDAKYKVAKSYKTPVNVSLFQLGLDEKMVLGEEFGPKVTDDQIYKIVIRDMPKLQKYYEKGSMDSIYQKSSNTVIVSLSSSKAG